MKRKSFTTPLLLLGTGCVVTLGGFWAQAYKSNPSFWENKLTLSAWIACELALVAAAVAVLASEALPGKRQRWALSAIWGVSVVAFAALSGTLEKYLSPKFFIACGVFIGAAFVFLLLIKAAKTARMKTLTALALCTFLVEIATSLLRLMDFKAGVAVGCGVYLCFTFLCLLRLKPKLKAWQAFLAILLGYLLLAVPVRVYTFEASLPSFLDAIFRMGGIIAGFALYRICGRMQGCGGAKRGQVCLTS
jgi:hypothetical protein